MKNKSENPPDSIGERLKKARMELNLTQEVFASCVGISNSAICMYEAGLRQPREATLSQICNKFSINRKYLTDGEDPMFFSTFSSTELVEMLCSYHNLEGSEQNLLINYLNLNKQDRRSLCALLSKLIRSTK